MGGNSNHCLRNIKLLLEILILSLSWTSSLSDTTKEIEYQIIREGGDWQLIEEGWPTVGSNQFIYTKNAQEITWKLNETYLNGFDAEQVFRLKFKFWMNEKNSKKGRISSYISFDEKEENVVSLRDRYINDIYKDNWMPFEFTFSNKDSYLIKIYTKLSNETDLVAFKDIIIEQELNQLTDKTFNSWKHFGHEFQQMLNQTEKIFYFINDDCSKGCNITIDSTIMENVKNITFKYISVNGKISFDPNLNPDKQQTTDKLAWVMFEPKINSQSFRIYVETNELKDYKASSFVAIKELKAEWKNKTIAEANAGFKDIDFPFVFHPKLTLAKDLPTINDTVKFYFANKSLSTFELLVEKNFLKNDYCLSFEYMTKTPETELVFSYNLNDDEYKQVFFTSKTLISDQFVRHETLCLSNFIALDIKNGLMKLFITVKFNDEKNSDEENKFYIKSLELNNESVERKISFEKLWGYLSDFNLEEWKNQWNPTKESHFSLKDDHIEFNDGNTEKTLKSAELSSDWIVYNINNRENFRINGKLMVWLDDRKSFNSFILTAKVCNSISKCQWLSLKSTDWNETHSFYDLNGFNLTDNKSELIRLVLNVKYGFTNGNQLKVNLKLLNFGNPCFGYKYCQLDTDKSNPNPIFDCPQGKTGVDCENTDYCFERHNITSIKDNKTIYMSGDRFCNDYNDLAKCLQDDNGFRCECQDITGPIYNREKNICEQPTHKFTAWDESQPLSLKPKTEQNNLEISFENIKSDGNICIRFYYNATGLTYIRALYNTEDLFEVSLDNNANVFDFCLLDFKTTIENKFAVNMKFRNDLNIFELENFKSYSNNKEQSKTFNVYRELGKLENWRALPSSIWTINDNHATMEVEANKSFKALLTSGWIDSDEDFNNFKNQFKFLFSPKDLIDTFKIEESIRDKGNKKYLNQVFTNSKDHPQTGTIKFNRGSNYPFRITLEIENTATTTSKFSLTITDFFFGNACLMANGNSKCPYDQKCTTKTFGEFNCECIGICKSNCDKLKSLHNNTIKYCTNSATLPNVFNGCYDIEKSYECYCPNSDFVWSINKTDILGTCKRKTEDKSKPETCSSSGCKFLLLNTFQWSNPVMPKVSKELFPFHYATKSGGKLSFQVNVNSSQEVCFRFHYWVPKDSDLRILYQEMQGLDLGQTFNSKAQKWFPDLKDEPQTVCTSDIEKYNFHSNLIGFENTNIVALKIKKVQEVNNKSNAKPLPYLTIIENSTDVNNQWSLLHPNITSPCLQIPKGNPNEIRFRGCGDGNLKRKSYLISNIIKNDKYKRLGFQISNILSSKNLQIRVVLFDQELKIIETVASIIDSDLKIVKNRSGKNFNYNKLNFTSLTTEFRLGFIIEYTDKSTSFSLINVNVNDPCITDENSLNTCHNNGKCGRKGAEAFCKCNPGWLEEGWCESKDWCNITNTVYKELSLTQTGNEICASMNQSSCINGQKGFLCECKKEYFWDDTKHICRSMPGCLDKQCLTNEICIDSIESNDQSKCVCAPYFVNINVKKNISGLNCQKFDWCNNDHIEYIKNQKDFKYDEQYTRECKYKCEKMSDDEYGKPQRMCSCPSGTYIKENKCKAYKCEFPTLNNCNQICKDNDTIPDGFQCECQDKFYELKENKCVLKNTSDKCPEKCKGTSFCDENRICICRKNYVYINDDCEPNIDAFNNLDPNIRQQTCPNGFKKNRTELNCLCNDKMMELNSKTKLCEPKALCSVGSQMFNECKNKSAVCAYDKYKNAICDCLDGSEKKAKNSDGVCVGICELNEINSTSSRRQVCENRNAICDPFSGECICKPGLFSNETTRECEASSKTVQFKISIKNTDLLFQQISSSSIKVPLRYKREIDENNIQFNRVDFNKTSEINLIIKKKFANNNDRKTIITTNALQDQLLKVLSMAPSKFTKNNVAYDSCVMKDKSLECNFLIDLPQQYSKEALNIYLKESCHSKGKDCFFYQNGKVLFTVDSSSFDKNNISNFQPCVKNRCDTLADCQPNNGLFSCLCNETYFSVATTKNVKVRDRNEPQVLQTCQMKELCETKCKTKTTDKMNCRQSTHFNESEKKWSAEPECYCAEKFNLVSNNNQRQCTAVCKDISCNSHGKCLAKGLNGFACECDDGWSGAQCETEHKIALGGWIAGIVILALLVVVVSGIAFVYYRRSSNGGYSGSGHQMDDYSGHSFRTGQSRGPSQGTDNPSFHRN